jgi:hypothetical protein
LCFSKEEKLSPLDLAGSHLSNEASIVFLTYFENNFCILEKVFEGKLLKNKIEAER